MERVANAREHRFGTLVGGTPCLDFVNTTQGRIARPGRASRNWADVVVGERLESYEALLEWGGTSGVLIARDVRVLAQRAAAAPAEATAVLRRSQELREAIYRLFKAAVEDWPPLPEDLTVLNREARRVRGHEVLVEGPPLRWEWERTPALDRVLWPVVRSAVDVLTGPDLTRVGQCPGDECGWLFLDTSRSRRRQWCTMSECGNVAKVRRFREKRRTRSQRI